VGQRDPTVTEESGRSEGPTGQWKVATEVALSGAGEDGAGMAEMPPVAARSGAGG
jgi:hypothetical protein